MSFPLLRTSAATIFVDDDYSYLETMAYVVGEQHRPSFFVNVQEVDDALAGQDELLHKEQKMLGAINAGGDRMPISTALEYFSWPGRHQIVSVLISDQVMPAESGVSLCERHGHYGLRRILLTGAADSQLAVNAFNSGAIELFIPKQSSGLLSQINEALVQQIDKSMEIRGVHLRDSLPAWAHKAISSTRFSLALAKYLNSKGIIEYLVIGQPFGVLGLTRKGEVLWCPIESEATLVDVVNTIRDMGWQASATDQVASRAALCNMDLVAQVDSVAPAIASAVPVVPDHKIFIAAFPVPGVEVCLVPENVKAGTK